MRLHSDENIHCASQWSSLVRFLMLLNWVLPSSVVKKSPTATCLLGQFRKMNPWLSWALPLADHKHLYCSSWVQWNDKYETFLPPEFQHLELPTYSILNALVSVSPAKLQSLPAIPEPPPMLSSCLCSSGLDSAQALLSSTPLCLGQGETSSHRKGVGLLLVVSLQQVKHKQDKPSVCLR